MINIVTNITEKFFTKFLKLKGTLRINLISAETLVCHNYLCKYFQYKKSARNVVFILYLLLITDIINNA